MKMLVSIASAVLLIGCGTEAQPRGGLKQSGATPAASSGQSPPESAVEPEGTAAPLAERLQRLVPPGYTVVRSVVSGTPIPLGVLVTYRPSTADRTAECLVGIAREQQGRLALVETSTHLLQCSTVPSSEAIDAAVQVSVKDGAVELVQTGPRGESRFTLIEARPGDWRIGNAYFSFVDDDPDTEAVEVVTESVEYDDIAGMPRVSDYEYALIKPDLIRQQIK